MSDTTTAPDATRDQGAASPSQSQHGDFIWYELLTTDPDAAQKFYSEVVGWTVRPSGMPGMDYRLISASGGDSSTPAGNDDVAGLMKIAPDMGGMKPIWLGYIGVEDVDEAVAKVKADGGAIHVPPTDIPNVGRFALLADPQGAMIYVMRGASDQRSDAFVASMKPGHGCWNELATTDPAAAIDFYARHFGWTTGDAMPMGELGEYRFLHRGEPMIGAVMKQPAPGMPSMWIYYFYVPDLDAAVDAIKAGGGAIHFGPTEIPGGDFSVTAGDPQGAIFGLVGPSGQAG